MELIHKRTYADRYDLEAVIERFYDSFPEEWGAIVDNEIERNDYIDGVYESIDEMENDLELKVEIYRYDDGEEDETWICEAYKVS
ncbi:hypothetical protein [Bacillus sp. BB56-3]|uniref:hypothetical protein n=1 Tax=Bacillus sp. BB56-3 TaxID=2217831 RepID=UPI0011EE9C9F|nr:hypothetical protein [Bacillus sp. BB56-3]KAA0784318.1 hypothetical protein DN406_27280 [Bacillus sp. BB56-3]